MRILVLVGVLGVGAFEPLGGVGAGGFRDLCQPEEGRRCTGFVSGLRTEFTQPQDVSFHGLERHHTLQHDQAILLTSVLAQVFKRALVSLDREFPVRGF